MSKEKQIEENKFYVVHTKSGYWVGAYIFSEQLRHAKIYTSLHYANETAERLNRGDPNEFSAKILEVKICLADEEAGYRKQSEGEWHTIVDNKTDIVTECSACKNQFWFMKKGQLNIDRMPFCPSCGAKMKGGAE